MFWRRRGREGLESLVCRADFEFIHVISSLSLSPLNINSPISICFPGRCKGPEVPSILIQDN